jgi:3-dehydroquinate synthase
MGAAVQFSRQWAGLTSDEADRALSLIRKLGLPTELPADVDVDSLLVALERDKKLQAGICHFVLISKIGQAVIHPISVEDLRQSLTQIQGFRDSGIQGFQ